MTKRYIIETTYVVKERVAIVADCGLEAIAIASTNDLTPYESVRIDKNPKIIHIENIGR